ncbi:MAG: LiaF transmembrane domain-containing protein [Gammaproteobacteria bacterium]
MHQHRSGRPARRRTQWGWWPLIPGGILTLIGLMLAADQVGLLGAIGHWWPAILIVIGLYILLRRRVEPPG